MTSNDVIFAAASVRGPATTTRALRTIYIARQGREHWKPESGFHVGHSLRLMSAYSSCPCGKIIRSPKKISPTTISGFDTTG